MCKRSFVTGSAVDTKIAQASWNLDRMDGSGPSRKVLDLSKAQILIFDYQWLGIGRVRLGFDIDGIVYYVHQFLHANIITSVYMTSANLPVRAEIYNDGVAAGPDTFEFVCSQISSEGGFDDTLGNQWSANIGRTPLGVTTLVPVLSARAKAAGPNGVRNKGQIILKLVDVIASDNSALVEIYLNPTLGGGGTAWTARDAARSIAEFDVGSTTISGGFLVDSFYVPAGGGGPFSSGGSGSASPFRKFPLVYTPLTNTQDIVTVAVASTAGTSNVNASITWQEFF
jgi:hypothetical protein